MSIELGTELLSAVTVVWIALPLFLGFVIYLLPALDRYLALAIALLSTAYGLSQILAPTSTQLLLTGSFGITLAIDSLSGYFVLTNALVTMAVVLYCWPKTAGNAGKNAGGKTAFFFAQIAFLHGSVNAVFICADFMSLYVALEVIGVAAFLLIAYPRSDRTLWVGLRYLFVSNTAMLFYLLGAVLVYQSNNSFAFTGLKNAPWEAIALISLGLLTKGGVFISGLWLPLTHAESDTPVSALLSGAVIKTGVFPLVRCALLVEEIGPMLQLFSIGTALLGTGCALFEKDTKRTLAWSTISQMGFVLITPAAAGVYALSHGLAKAALFLSAGRLPSRKFAELKQQPVSRSLWLVIVIASLSISGFPLLAGFGAKALTLKGLGGWSAIAMNIAAVGTAAVLAKFIFLPFTTKSSLKMNGSFWIAVTVLLASLVAGGTIALEQYTVANLIKSLVTIAGGWLAYYFFVRKQLATDSGQLSLFQASERLEHLIGSMSIVLLLLFWWAIP